MLENPFLTALFLPLSMAYGGIIWFRNLLYDRGVFSSAEFDFPVISIGNLSLGGTGKTPHVEYFVKLIATLQLPVSVLSRGYGRKTKGFKEVTATDIAEQSGDEPCLIKQKYPFAHVFVGEERILAIPEILSIYPDTKVLVLDDAFQHRSVRPGLNVLITTWQKPYTRDFLLPIGRLREGRQAAKRADIVVVSKCPTDLSLRQRETLRSELQLEPGQELYFSTFQYGTPYNVFHPEQRIPLNTVGNVLFFCGIAMPQHAEEYIIKQVEAPEFRFFRDHYPYEETDIKELISRFQSLKGDHSILLTTEKDIPRLKPYSEILRAAKVPLYVLPVSVSFFPEDEPQIRSRITDYLERVSQLI